MAPSEYEEDTRGLVVDFKAAVHRELDNFKIDISTRLGQVETNITNHLAHRLPTWASVVFALLTCALGVLAGLKL